MFYLWIFVFWLLYEQFFQSPHTSLRKLSLGSVNQYIMLMPSVSIFELFYFIFTLDVILVLGVDSKYFVLITCRLYLYPWINTFRVCLFSPMILLEKCENW